MARAHVMNSTSSISSSSSPTPSAVREESFIQKFVRVLRVGKYATLTADRRAILIANEASFVKMVIRKEFPDQHGIHPFERQMNMYGFTKVWRADDREALGYGRKVSKGEDRLWVHDKVTRIQSLNELLTIERKADSSSKSRQAKTSKKTKKVKKTKKQIGLVYGERALSGLFDLPTAIFFNSSRSGRSTRQSNNVQCDIAALAQSLSAVDPTFSSTLEPAAAFVVASASASPSPSTSSATPALSPASSTSTDDEPLTPLADLFEMDYESDTVKSEPDEDAYTHDSLLWPSVVDGFFPEPTGDINELDGHYD